MEQPDKKRKKVLLFIKEKERTDEEIVNFLGSKDDWELMLADFLDDNFIRSVYDGKYIIAPDGEEYLKIDSWIDKKQIIPIIISVFLTLGGALYANSLTEPYSVLMEPTLRLYLAPTHGGIASISGLELNKTTGGLQHISVCIMNEGGRGTGNIYYRIDSQLNNGITSDIIHIPNLIGGNFSCDILVLSEIATVSGRTDENGLYVLEKPALPKGRMKFNVTLDCDNCEQQRQAHYLNACIYYDSYVFDC